MENPYKVILDKIQVVDSRLDELLERIPKEIPIQRYSPQELAQATGIGTQTILTCLKDGRIKGKRFGRKYLISAEEFDRACSEIRTIKYKRS